MTRHPRRLAPALVLGATLSVTAACGGGGSGFSGSSSGPSQATGKADLSVLINSSGAAETDAVQAAAKAWAAKSGNTATVTPAQNGDQQLGQAFAANKAPDVFYLDAAKLADYASTGALYAYGDKAAGAADFYPSLKETFSYKGTFYCAPKDFSTLALVINTDLWAKAGLTPADVPTTWDSLTRVATTLKTKLPDVAPLVVTTGHDRADAFITQAGGRLVAPDGTVTADSPANVTGLTYVKSLLQGGLLKYNTAVGADWGGEALGKGKTVMTIEGNWIEGSMKKDYPGVKYTVAPLPAGPGGKGTLTFTNCWGIPAQSAHKQQAVDFVNAMTAKDQQLTFAKAFGVIPSVQSAKSEYTQQFPSDVAFLNQADVGVGPVKAPKVTQVLSDYDNQLASLATADPKAILSRLQTNLRSAG